jgi:L-threonylcarbamoyladenylate synthase
MNINKILKAVEVLRNGGVVVMPTDTVWGMGASIESSEGIRKLYRIKKREKDKQTAVLVADIRMAEQYGVFNQLARSLASKYWPGALTLVVPAKEKVTELILGRERKVGLRVTKHKIVQDLCQKLNAGIVAGSANFAGEKPAKARRELDGDLISKVDLVVSGEAGGQEASTVVEVFEDKVKVLREGPIKV